MVMCVGILEGFIIFIVICRVFLKYSRYTKSYTYVFTIHTVSGEDAVPVLREGFFPHPLYVCLVIP